MALCVGCGNEIQDPERCPICEAGRAPPKKRDKDLCECPRCGEVLEQQDWEGTSALTCPSCHGTFFPERGLEMVLNKLRATCDPVDMDSVLKEFKGRFTRELPTAVRYKTCPVCLTVMMRKNYATVSGVIVDYCGDHGIWVDEHAFAELADFICRGGDMVARQADRVRDLNARASGGRLIDRLLGNR